MPDATRHPACAKRHDWRAGNGPFVACARCARVADLRTLPDYASRAILRALPEADARDAEDAMIALAHGGEVDAACPTCRRPA